MKVQITGKIEGLKEDLENEEKSIKEQVNSALLNVGTEMQRELQSMIGSEVYEKYAPKVYIRRSSHPSYGRPLIDDDNFDISAKNQTLDLVYEPTGEHKVSKWHERDNDNLIEWLQKEHEIGGSYIPARPFWNDFIDKQMDGGFMEKFIREMSPKYTVETDGRDDETISEFALEYLPQD